MPLTGHVVVWITAVALMGLASPIVRAYADYLERRTRARTDEVIASLADEAKREGQANASPGVGST